MMLFLSGIFQAEKIPDKNSIIINILSVSVEIQTVSEEYIFLGF